MSDLDLLVLEKLIPFREKALVVLAQQHPFVHAFLNAYLKDKNNRVGFQITENGQVAGTYTFTLDGLHISKTDIGVLEPAFHAPFLGTVKLYALTEKSELKKMLADQSLLTDDIFKVAREYLPMMTIKFAK